MNKFAPSLFRACCAAVALAASCAAASATQTVVQSTDYGLLTLPHTQGFSLSLAPMASDDTFLSDYGFTIGADGSFSSAVVTFDLGSAFQLSDLSVTLLDGNAWSGPVPSDLTAAQIADRDGRIVASGGGSAMNQVINQMTLGAGSYVVEVSGRVTGASGGSYGGLLNVAAVPEPAGFLLAFAGLGLVALARRRAAR
jgi:uncharacterized protein (TIGR03382 family)